MARYMYGVDLVLMRLLTDFWHFITHTEHVAITGKNCKQKFNCKHDFMHNNNLTGDFVLKYDLNHDLKYDFDLLPYDKVVDLHNI